VKLIANDKKPQQSPPALLQSRLLVKWSPTFCPCIFTSKWTHPYLFLLCGNCGVCHSFCVLACWQNDLISKNIVNVVELMASRACAMTFSAWIYWWAGRAIFGLTFFPLKCIGQFQTSISHKRCVLEKNLSKNRWEYLLTYGVLCVWFFHNLLRQTSYFFMIMEY